MALGNNLRKFRKAKGELLIETAAAVGMDPGQLSKLEREIVGCSDEMKVALAVHFQTQIGRLFFQGNVEENSKAGVQP